MRSGVRGTVLVVEDSEQSAELLRELVEGEGFEAEVARSAEEGVAAHERMHPVAVLLDWGLPDGPGTEVCREIRKRDGAVPIIFVSGRDDETSIARALDAGADDYVPQPVRAGELMARLEAHLRRVAALSPSPNGATAHAAKTRIAHLGALQIDLGARQVRNGGVPVRLGALEFKLLEYLLVNAGTAVSREQILAEVYGYDADIGSERVDLLVRRLRAKLGEHDAHGLIVAVPGYGYRLERREAAR
jgi:DNA-binding response OmpR family regulator